jgi:hypothetical protein
MRRQRVALISFSMPFRRSAESADHRPHRAGRASPALPTHPPEYRGVPENRLPRARVKITGNIE